MYRSVVTVEINSGYHGNSRDMYRSEVSVETCACH